MRTEPQWWPAWLAVARSVALEPSGAVRFRGVRERARGTLRAQALTDWVYARFFIGWHDVRPDGFVLRERVSGSRHLLAALHHAVGDATTWEPGFRVRHVAASGLAVTRDGLQLHVRASEVRPRGARAGTTVRVRIPCARPASIDGFFAVVSRGGPAAQTQPELKLYLNLTEPGVIAFSRFLTHDKTLARARFDAKCVHFHEGFSRRDTALVYADVGSFPVVARAVRRWASTHRRYFRPEVPPLVFPLLPGLGAAESPHVGDESFGTHRSRLLAEALLQFLEQRSGEKRSLLELTHQRFAREGLSLEAPWLGALGAKWVNDLA